MIKTNLDLKDFQKWGNDYIMRTKDFGPVLKGRIYQMVLKELRGNFLFGGRPGWTPLSPKTRAKPLPVRRKGILWITGNLMKAASSMRGLEREVGKNYLVVRPKANKMGTAILYHHRGGSFVRPPIRAKRLRWTRRVEESADPVRTGGVLVWTNKLGQKVFAKSARMCIVHRPPRPIMVMRPEKYMDAKLMAVAWLAGKYWRESPTHFVAEVISG